MLKYSLHVKEKVVKWLFSCPVLLALYVSPPPSLSDLNPEL